MRSNVLEVSPTAKELYNYAVALEREHAALVAVAEAAERLLKLSVTHPIHPDFRVSVQNQAKTALAALAAVRAGSEVAKPAGYEAELRAYEEAHRVWMNTPVWNNKEAKAELKRTRDAYEAARKEVE